MKSLFLTLHLLSILYLACSLPRGGKTMDEVVTDHDVHIGIHDSVSQRKNEEQIQENDMDMIKNEDLIALGNTEIMKMKEIMPKSLKQRYMRGSRMNNQLEDKQEDVLSRRDLQHNHVKEKVTSNVPSKGVKIEATEKGKGSVSEFVFPKEGIHEVVVPPFPPGKGTNDYVEAEGPEYYYVGGAKGIGKGGTDVLVSKGVSYAKGTTTTYYAGANKGSDGVLLSKGSAYLEGGATSYYIGEAKGSPEVLVAKGTYVAPAKGTTTYIGAAKGTYIAPAKGTITYIGAKGTSYYPPHHPYVESKGKGIGTQIVTSKGTYVLPSKGGSYYLYDDEEETEELIPHTTLAHHHYGIVEEVEEEEDEEEEGHYHKGRYYKGKGKDSSYHKGYSSPYSKGKGKGKGKGYYGHRNHFYLKDSRHYYNGGYGYDYYGS